MNVLGQFQGNIPGQFLDGFGDNFRDKFRDNFRDSFEDNFRNISETISGAISGTILRHFQGQLQEIFGTKTPLIDLQYIFFLFFRQEKTDISRKPFPNSPGLFI